MNRIFRKTKIYFVLALMSVINLYFKFIMFYYVLINHGNEEISKEKKNAIKSIL